jgi:hypothetical protein
VPLRQREKVQAVLWEERYRAMNRTNKERVLDYLWDVDFYFLTDEGGLEQLDHPK